MKEFLKKVDEWIAAHIKLDDTLHFIAGMICSAIIAILAMLLLGPVSQFGLICCIALMGTIVISLAKEGVDTNVKHEDLERRDIFWTMMGGTIMVVILIFFRNTVLYLG